MLPTLHKTFILPWRTKGTMNALEQYVNEKGLDWVVAAVVDGSIGYYTPEIAERMIKATLEGKLWISERTLACYSGDQVQEILSDIRKFEYLERHYPDRAKAIIEFVKTWRNLNTADALTVGLMYPTLL